MTGLIKFLHNFWVCVIFAALGVLMAASRYADGDTGWAWFDLFIACLWLNSAYRAMKETKDEQEGRTKEG